MVNEQIEYEELRRETNITRKKEHYKKLMQEEKKFKRDRNKFMIILKKALKEIRGLF